MGVGKTRSREDQNSGDYTTFKKGLWGISLAVQWSKTPRFYCRGHGLDPWLGN